MSDLISRKAAIDAVKKNTFRLTFAKEQNGEGHVAWSAEAVYSDVMEGALLALPSAQPENRTEERTKTHACNMGEQKEALDMAIKALKEKERKEADHSLSAHWCDTCKHLHDDGYPCAECDAIKDNDLWEPMEGEQ